MGQFQIVRGDGNEESPVLPEAAVRIQAVKVGMLVKPDMDRSTSISSIWPRTKVPSLSALQPQRSRQLIEQCLRFLQIGGIKPLGKPAVDGARMSRTSVILA